mmetsp:Transcript_21016/g.20144  ORF Transcript_21016/g.20144 Transcript_21016/m.20144 type:complete len:96 (+) Transcript_21016:458-745(+)
MIKQYDTVILYLRDLKNNLEVLKISDNPFTKYGENEYKQFSIAYLKELKYLDYELINETVRQKAEDRYKDDIKDKDLLVINNKGGNQQSNENKED